MKFEVGDRVRIYGNSQVGQIGDDCNLQTGSVERIFSGDHEGWINVRIDKRGFYTVHSKQCRKLKKVPERRRLWAVYRDEVLYCTAEKLSDITGCYKNDYVEFIEVRKKK